MDTTRFVDAVKADLEAAAAVGGEALVEAAGRLSAALDASMRLALLDALSEASMELTRQLAAGRIEVRLAGREVELTYVADTPAPSASEEDASARITLRLPERLKADAEAAAARESISTNAWLVRAVSAALAQRHVGDIAYADSHPDERSHHAPHRPQPAPAGVRVRQARPEPPARPRSRPAGRRARTAGRRHRPCPQRARGATPTICPGSPGREREETPPWQPITPQTASGSSCG